MKKIIIASIFTLSSLPSYAGTIECQLIKESGTRYLPDIVTVAPEEADTGKVKVYFEYIKPSLNSFKFYAYANSLFGVVGTWKVFEYSDKILHIRYLDEYSRDELKFNLEKKTLDIKYFSGLQSSNEYLSSEGKYSCN